MPLHAHFDIHHDLWLTTPAVRPRLFVIPSLSRNLRAKRMLAQPTAPLVALSCVRYADRLRRGILRSLRSLWMTAKETDSTPWTAYVARTIVDAG